MPGEGEGLVSGYQGRGAATILSGGEQEPLAILQRKKMLAQRDKEKGMASSQAATGQLTGAWDRDIPNLAQKRGAYTKLNSHWMQQGTDPRDPSNEDVYTQNRDVYGRLQDTFKASASHKQVYDKTRELISKDRDGKYDREASEADLEQWAALPVEERMGTAAPIPVLKPENFSVSQLVEDTAKSINSQVESQKPYIDPTTGKFIFPSKEGPQKGWQDIVKLKYMENYDKIIKKNPEFDGEDGYQRYENLHKPHFETKETFKISQKPTPPAREERAAEKQKDMEFMVDRAAKIQVFDTETLEGTVNTNVYGNAIVDYYINSKTGEVQFLAFDEQGNLAPLVSMDTRDPSSSSKIITMLMGGKVTPEQQRKLSEASHQGYDKQDKTAEIDSLVNDLIKGEVVAISRLKEGGKFKRKDGDFFTSEEIKDIKFDKSSRFSPYPSELEFELKSGEFVTISAKDIEALTEVVENSGAITRDVLTKKGAAGLPSKEPSGKPKIEW